LFCLLRKSELANVVPIIENLQAVVGRGNVLTKADELLVYECDGLPQHKHLPRAVVFPNSTEETAEVMRVLARNDVPFTPRGAGTGLSGGALALDRGVVIELARMRKILTIDERNQQVVVQAGVVNAHVSRAVAHLGLHYVPDPSSQGTCTIGGNIAENAGGIHCLKYGTTTDHVIGARVVLAGGEIVELEGGEFETPGYDLLGVFVGSEGTFGIATEATLRLVPVPPAVRTLLAEFSEVNDASHAVSAIIAAGVMPAALEMMDREIIRAVEASVFAAGLSLDAGAALLIELDGIEAGIDDEAERVKSICLNYRAQTCRLARDETERKKLWAARKGAFGAVGRIAPDSMIQDAVVPRSRLPEVLDESYRIAAKYSLRLANVFHAGDGNLHPLICFDSRSPEEVLRVKEAGRELMETCVRAGGSITGEHGVGLDKRDFLPLIFSEDDMDTMLRVRAAFDPLGLCNPGKIIPMLRGCGEARAVAGPGDGETGRRGEGETNEIAGTGERMNKAVSALEPRAGGVPGGGAPPGCSSRPQQRGAASLAVLDDEPERQRLSALRSGTAANSSYPSIGILRQPRNFDSDDAAKQLSAIVGEANISVSSRLPVSPSPSLPVTVSPSLTVSPGSIPEVCEIMKLASSVGWALVPAGAETWVDAGDPLVRADIILSTRRLNQIIHHEPADLVASTQAGVTLDAFNQVLAQGGQWLPLDPPDDGRATIGGVVATGLRGAQSYGYGPPRRYVIGMKVALGDGRLIKAGGNVVKNVAGYDLCKLFTGSYGTLGMITELTFKLRPLPAKEVTVLATGSRDAVFNAARSIVKGGLFPVGLELLSAATTQGINVEISSDSVLLLIRFAGTEKTVGYQVAEATRLLSGGAGITDIETESDDRLLWRRLAAIPLGFHEGTAWRVTVKPAQLGSFIEAVEQRFRDLFSSWRWHAGVADGRMRMIERLRGDPAEHARELKHLRAVAQSFGGSLMIENAPAEIRQAIGAWGSFGSSATLLQRVKEQLDPEGLLSPGRFGFQIEAVSY
jgi:glycolate oxidase subunit GlcD